MQKSHEVNLEIQTCPWSSSTSPFLFQQETEKLEEEKADLQKEIENLQKEKDKLEFMLVAHKPVCKLPIEEHHQPHQQQCTPLPLTMRPNMGTQAQMNHVIVKQEPEDDDVSKPQRSVIKPICLSGGGGMYCTDGESLNTPVVAASTPAATPNNPSLIFTYPNMMEPESPSPSSESCSKAHRRSSSSGDQSSDSLNSPTLLALWARPRLGVKLRNKHCGPSQAWGSSASPPPTPPSWRPKSTLKSPDQADHVSRFPSKGRPTRATPRVSSCCASM